MTKKVVNISEFNTLSKEMQLDILQRDGAHVGKRIVNGKKMILYQLYGFYVEISYKDYRKDINSITTSESSEIVEPYLNQIHIRDLDKDDDKK